MPESDSTPEVRLELCVRSLLPRGSRGSQEATIERLRRLESRGAVDEVDVVVWGRGLETTSAASRTGAGREIRERVDAFYEWASERGYSLRTCFSSREVRSEIVDEEYEALVFPAMVLAAFRDDAVAFVAPCTDGETAYTVADLLDALDREAPGEPFEQLADPSVDVRARRLNESA